MSELRIFVCGKCRIEFGVPPDFDDERRRDGDAFWCPRGDTLWHDDATVAAARTAIAGQPVAKVPGSARR